MGIKHQGMRDGGAAKKKKKVLKKRLEGGNGLAESEGKVLCLSWIRRQRWETWFQTAVWVGGIDRYSLSAKPFSGMAVGNRMGALDRGGG